MASANPFDLLGNDDNDDPSGLIAAAQQKLAAAKNVAVSAPVPQAAAKLPSKPLPPSQAVREARNNSGPQRGGFGGGPQRGGFGGGRGRDGPGGRGGRSYLNREYRNTEANGYSGGYGGGYGGGVEDGETNKQSAERGPRQPYRGSRRGGYMNGEADAETERPQRRMFERRSGTGRGNEFKREGAGRGNWGTAADDVIAQEFKEVNVEDNAPSPDKQTENKIVASETEINDKQEEVSKEIEEDAEDKEMTLEEYEKIREEKRKNLLAMKAEERKVDVKEFESMQPLSLKKKGNDEIFIKLGSEKDRKQRENAEREEKAKKSISINEFLKPADGRNYSGGRGRGRGRSDRAPRGGFGGRGNANYTPEALIEIADPGQFPTLGGK